MDTPAFLMDTIDISRNRNQTVPVIKNMQQWVTIRLGFQTPSGPMNSKVSGFEVLAEES